MDPLKEIGRKQKAMDKVAYQDALNKPIDAIQQSTPYRLADLIMNGEDADIGMAESLIPTVSLQKKIHEMVDSRHMRDATDYIPDDPVQITPFVHLRDIFSKRK